MDFTAPITAGTILLVFGTVAGLLIKEKMKRYDKHLEECQEKSVNHIRLEGKVCRIEDKLDDMKDAMSDRTAKIDAMDNKLDELTLIIINKL